MTQENAEYQALDRFITADKRYRRFVYALSFILFLLVIWGGWQIQQNIEHKIDGLINGSVARGNARAADQKTIARETIRYTTCIFVVPIEQRTTDTQEKCFEAADLPGGLKRADFSPIVIPNPVAATSTGVTPVQSSSASARSSSSNTTPVPTASQPNTSQPSTPPAATTPNCTIDILFIHLGRCQ